MDDEAFKCMHLAKDKSGLSYVIKGNDLKRKSEQYKASIAMLSKKNRGGEIEEKRKKLSK